MDLVLAGDSRPTLFLKLCHVRWVCVFWCLLRSTLILRHFVQLRNSFLYLATYFDENSVFWGNSRHLPAMTETGTRFWSWWEERAQTQGQTHTHPAGCISLEYSKETKNKTNQLVFLLTAANCCGTFNSLWSHKRQTSCHLLCMPGEDPVPVARATGPSSCITLSRVPLWMETPREKWAPERGRGRGCCLWHAQEKTPELGRVGRGLKWGTGQVEERPMSLTSCGLKGC